MFAVTRRNNCPTYANMIIANEPKTFHILLIKNELKKTDVCAFSHMVRFHYFNFPYSTELKTQNADLRNELESERAKYSKLKDKFHSEKLTANAKNSKLEQDLYLASENFAQSETNRERLDNELTDLDKQRKEQLLELGVLREKEKQEAEVRYIKAFKKAELEIKNQAELKTQEKLEGFRKKNRKTLEVLEAQLKTVESSYRDKCGEYILVLWKTIKNDLN